MEQDDGKRPSYGLGIFPLKHGESVRLVLDDLHLPDGAVHWEQWAFFTILDIDRKAFDACSLSDEQFAELGRTLVARLTALGDVLGDRDPPREEPPE